MKYEDKQIVEYHPPKYMHSRLEPYQCIPLIRPLLHWCTWVGMAYTFAYLVPRGESADELKMRVFNRKTAPVDEAIEYHMVMLNARLTRIVDWVKHTLACEQEDSSKYYQFIDNDEVRENGNSKQNMRSQLVRNRPRRDNVHPQKR